MDAPTMSEGWSWRPDDICRFASVSSPNRLWPKDFAANEHPLATSTATAIATSPASIPRTCASYQGTADQLFFA